MRLNMWGLTAVMLCVVCGTAVGEDFLHARVSYDAGTSMVKGRDDADWSYATINTIVLPGDTLWVDKEGTMELEMSGGSFLRMADGSKADVETLPPSGKIRAWNGSFYAHRVSRSTGSLEVDTPLCVVDIDPNSQVRVDIVGDGATTVSVRWGHAVVRCEAGGDTSLNAGQRSYVDPGYLPSDATAFNMDVEDDFDSWNRDRARLLAEGEGRVPPAVHMANTPIGVTDLSPYGEWVEVDSAYYWRPTVVVDYVPYRVGHWSYVVGAGYCWVDNYQFSYVTTHYGRWRYTDHYGWVWTYRDTWGPAWVEAVHYGPNFVWTPLDPFDRPCVAIGETFVVGSAHFGLFASSYCVADDLLIGRCMVMPVTTVVVAPVPVTQITVWDIHVGSGHDYHHDFAREAHLEVHDYPPTRMVRGHESLGPNAPPAHDRVASLETSSGRHEFATHAQGDRPRERAVANRPGRQNMEGRSVRVAPDIRESASDPRRSAALVHSATTPEGRGGAGAAATSRQGGSERSREVRSPRGLERSTSRPSASPAERSTETGRTPSRAERSRGTSAAEGGRGRSSAPAEEGKAGVRSERSAAPSSPAEAPSRSERTTVRSRSREAGPKPVPMRGSESAPSRTSSPRSEATGSSAPDRTPSRSRVERNQDAGSAIPSTRTRAERSQDTGSTGADVRTESPRSRQLRSAEPTETPVTTRSNESRNRVPESVRQEPSRNVQVERLAAPERAVPEQRIERQSVPTRNVEPRSEAVSQPRQEPARQQAPAGRRSNERDDSSDNSRRRR